MKPLERYRTGL